MRKAKDFAKARKDLFSLLKKYDPTNLDKWFNKLIRQLLEPNTCNFTARQMKELIELASGIGTDFERVYRHPDQKTGNNFLMDLARNLMDDVLREVLTNPCTTNFVSTYF